LPLSRPIAQRRFTVTPPDGHELKTAGLRERLIDTAT
jgi:hypothetical protein